MKQSILYRALNEEFYPSVLEGVFTLLQRIRKSVSGRVLLKSRDIYRTGLTDYLAILAEALTRP